MSRIFEALRKAGSSPAPQTRMAILCKGRAKGRDRRRSSRWALDANIRAYGRRPSGQPFYEKARTINVSIYGALLLTAVPIEEGQKLLLMNDVTQRQQICRIAYMRSRDMGQLEVAVEFPVPHGKFWRCPPARDGELRSAENRRFLRVMLSDRIMLTWKTSRQHVISRLDSLSPGGLFVNAQYPPSEGDIIDFCFKVPGGYVRGPGIVRHSQEGKGMGVQFTFMSQAERARLAHLLHKLLSSNPNP